MVSTASRSGVVKGQISEKKLIANRRNAQKSTGPTTSAGKNRSKFNAVKHGLLARHAVIPEYECDQEFDHLLRVLRSEFQPYSMIEETLVERIADCYWKLGRIAALRHVLMTNWLEKELEISKCYRPYDLNVEELSQLDDEELDFELSMEKDRMRPKDKDRAIQASLVNYMMSNGTLEKLQRYETATENRLYKALHELERLQRLRGGQFVTAPLIIESNQ